MSDLSPRDVALAKIGALNRRTGELTSYGEILAEETSYGRQIWDAGDDFGEMGPDLGPHD